MTPRREIVQSLEQNWKVSIFPNLPFTGQLKEKRNLSSAWHLLTSYDWVPPTRERENNKNLSPIKQPTRHQTGWWHPITGGVPLSHKRIRGDWGKSDEATLLKRHFSLGLRPSSGCGRGEEWEERREGGGGLCRPQPGTPQRVGQAQAVRAPPGHAPPGWGRRLPGKLSAWLDIPTSHNEFIFLQF